MGHLASVHAPPLAIASLAVVLIAAALLTLGWRLAVQRRFVAHRRVQTTAVVLTTLVGATWMARSLIVNVLPGLAARLGGAPYTAAVVHAVVGVTAASLGVYVVLAAGELLPWRLGLRRFKPVMRTSYGLYLAGAATGVVLYLIAYAGL